MAHAATVCGMAAGPQANPHRTSSVARWYPARQPISAICERVAEQREQQPAPAAQADGRLWGGPPPLALGRRAAFGLGGFALLAALIPARPSLAAATADWEPAVIRLELAPDQRLYNPADPQLRAAARLLQDALSAQDVQREEALWSEIIKEYGMLESNWVPDLVGRAWGNRGNARSRQGKLREALADYNESIRMCPWSVDPVLNRGVIMEALHRFEEAISDYRAVLAAAPDDPAGYNNLGNAYAGLGDWAAAAEYYGRATQLAPAFAFAQENRALALYQLGQDNRAIKEMRSLARKFPDSFPDARAALTAALWEAGLQAEAEAEWGRVGDPRYRDRAWLRNERRWPPRLVAALEAFLDIRGVPGGSGGSGGA